jgi:hypothetical protein
MGLSYKLGRKLHGVIYLHRISDVRVGGVSKRNFGMFRKLCGDSTLKNVLIVTNMWGGVNQDVGKTRETELANEDIFFKCALDNKAKLLRHDNTLDSARSILRHIIGNHPMSLRIQRELVEECKYISQTASAEEINHELLEQAHRHHQEVVELRQDIRAKDDESRKKLEAARTEMWRVNDEALELEAYAREERTSAGRRMQEMAEAARQRAERAEAERQYQLYLSKDRLQHATHIFSMEQKAMRQQMVDLERQLQHK